MPPRPTGAQFLSPGKLSRCARRDRRGHANCSECHSTGRASRHRRLPRLPRRPACAHPAEERGCTAARSIEQKDLRPLPRRAPRKETRSSSDGQAEAGSRFDHRLWRGGRSTAPTASGRSARTATIAPNRPGNATYLGLRQTACTSCHADPHEDRFQGAECTSCHNETDWTEVTNIRGNHPGLSLAGGHAKTECEACHDRGNVEPPSTGATCVSCHAQVHEAAFGDRCESCHASIRWLKLPRAIGLRAHPKTSLPPRGHAPRRRLPALPLSQAPAATPIPAAPVRPVQRLSP